MSDLLFTFKECLHQAAKTCRMKPGSLISVHGLMDFMENRVGEDEARSDIAYKAVRFFCQGRSRADEIFMCTVIGVCEFLKKTAVPVQRAAPIVPMKDLVALVEAGCNSQQFFNWLEANF